MKLPTIFAEKPETKSQKVDVREAFALWDILNSKYMALEKLVLCKSFVHDADLKLMLIKLEKDFHTNIEILQEQLKMFNIKSPNKNRVAGNSNMSSELFSDEFIAMEMLLYEQEHVENMLSCLYSTITNDGVRAV